MTDMTAYETPKYNVKLSDSDYDILFDSFNAVDEIVRKDLKKMDKHDRKAAKAWLRGLRKVLDRITEACKNEESA